MRMMSKGLTARQDSILGFIRDFTGRSGYPPSLREIAMRFGIKSPKNARKHLDALERKGFIKRTCGLSRAIEVLGQAVKGAVSIPIAGRVRAGEPHLAVEDIAGHITLDERFFNCRDAFLLKVEGESMRGAGIEDGDHIIVKPGAEVFDGDIVVAVLDGEATVKRFFRKGDTITLKPENPDFGPVRIKGEGRPFAIIGKAVFVIKNLGKTFP